LVWLTALGICSFLLAHAGVLPLKVGIIGIDLFLFLILTMVAILIYFINKNK